MVSNLRCIVHVILGIGACCARKFQSALGVLASRALFGNGIREFEFASPTTAHYIALEAHGEP